jgi:hypothetical protein
MQGMAPGGNKINERHMLRYLAVMDSIIFIGKEKEMVYDYKEIQYGSWLDESCKPVRLFDRHHWLDLQSCRQQLQRQYAWNSTCDLDLEA